MVTWDRVRGETSRDPELLRLMELAKEGFTEKSQMMPDGLLEFWSRRDKLYAVDNVVMDGARVVVPRKLRWEVLENLHWGPPRMQPDEVKGRDMRILAGY